MQVDEEITLPSPICVTATSWTFKVISLESLSDSSGPKGL